jgi:lipoprotein-releasing system ATP-binding protein
MILKPTLLLADEPTGNLDRKTAHAVGELLLDMQRREPTILVVVTHSPDLARRLPRQLEMNDGVLEPWRDSQSRDR